MKNIKILLGSILAAALLFLSGCYTQVAMTDNGSNNSGYDNSSENYQTPADSNYGDQYSQYGDQGYYDSTQQGTVNNYYYNYPPSYGGPWNNYYWNSSYSLGLSWGTPFYDPYYWDPFGLWSYYPGYYPYYSYFYPTYYPNYYGYYGYYNGYYGGYTSIIQRSHDTYRLRNNDGFRNSGDRGRNSGSNNEGILVNSPSTYGGRSEPTGRTMNKPSTTRNEPTNTVSGRNNGRQTTGRGYVPRSGNGRNSYNNNRGTRVQNINRTSGRYEPPRNYTPPRRTYSPPPRSYSPPQRTYSPPPSSYSAPRSYSPPARSEGSSSRSSSSGGGRRGR